MVKAKFTTKDLDKKLHLERVFFNINSLATLYMPSQIS